MIGKIRCNLSFFRKAKMKVLIVDDESQKIFKVKSEIELNFPEAIVDYCLTIKDAKRYLRTHDDIDLLIWI